MNKFSCAKEIYKIVIIRWSIGKDTDEYNTFLSVFLLAKFEPPYSGSEGCDVGLPHWLGNGCYDKGSNYNTADSSWGGGGTASRPAKSLRTPATTAARLVTNTTAKPNLSKCPPKRPPTSPPTSLHPSFLTRTRRRSLDIQGKHWGNP